MTEFLQHFTACLKANSKFKYITISDVTQISVFRPDGKVDILIPLAKGFSKQTVEIK